MSVTNSPAEMDEDAWDEAFRPIMNPDSGDDLFEAGDERAEAFLDGVDPYRIWTLWEHEDDEMFTITPGRYPRGCIGYRVTEVPWTDDLSHLVVVEPYDEDYIAVLRGEDEIDDEE